jgi:hypothetical protein
MCSWSSTHRTPVLCSGWLLAAASFCAAQGQHAQPGTGLLCAATGTPSLRGDSKKHVVRRDARLRDTLTRALRPTRSGLRVGCIPPPVGGAKDSPPGCGHDGGSGLPATKTGGVGTSFINLREGRVRRRRSGQQRKGSLMFGLGLLVGLLAGLLIGGALVEHRLARLLDRQRLLAESKRRPDLPGIA